MDYCTKNRKHNTIFSTVVYTFRFTLIKLNSPFGRYCVSDSCSLNHIKPYLPLISGRLRENLNILFSIENCNFSRKKKTKNKINHGQHD